METERMSTVWRLDKTWQPLQLLMHLSPLLVVCHKCLFSKLTWRLCNFSRSSDEILEISLKSKQLQCNVRNVLIPVSNGPSLLGPSSCTSGGSETVVNIGNVFHMSFVKFSTFKIKTLVSFHISGASTADFKRWQVNRSLLLSFWSKLGEDAIFERISNGNESSGKISILQFVNSLMFTEQSLDQYWQYAWENAQYCSYKCPCTCNTWLHKCSDSLSVAVSHPSIFWRRKKQSEDLQK